MGRNNEKRIRDYTITLVSVSKEIYRLLVRIAHMLALLTRRLRYGMRAVILRREMYIIMNKIILLGRLTKNPELRYTSTGKNVVQFVLAVNRPFQNAQGQTEADFIPCQIWGKTAETLANSVTKGQRLLVEGRLQNRSYTAKDGSNRWVTEVIGERFEFIERKTETTAQKQYTDNIDNYASHIPFDEEIPF